MAVMPFYATIDSSSRANPVGCGCKSKQGHLETIIYQRDNGTITAPIKVIQMSHTDENGKITLHTTVYHEGKLLVEHITDY